MSTDGLHTHKVAVVRGHCYIVAVPTYSSDDPESIVDRATRALSKIISHGTFREADFRADASFTTMIYAEEV